MKGFNVKTVGKALLIAAVVGAVMMLTGACAPSVPSITGSKRPLGPPADEATHPPELIGAWEMTKCCDGKCNGMFDEAILLLRTDGLGAFISRSRSALLAGEVMDGNVEWSTDGPVLLMKGGIPQGGDYTVSENTLWIKAHNDVLTGMDCTYEFVLKARDVKLE